MGYNVLVFLVIISFQIDLFFLRRVAILYIECLSDYSSFSNSFLDFNISIYNMPLIFYAHIAYIS